MIYHIYETQKKMFAPYANYLNNLITFTNRIEEINDFFNPFKNIGDNNLNNSFLKNHFINSLQAKNKLIYQFIKDYPKPEFGIKEIIKEDITYDIKEDVIIDKTFCELRHFIKTPSLEKKIPLLIVAPLSGHYATLLRDTVKSAIFDFEVYITDWKNCRDIPVEEGDFGFNDYVLYVEEFITHLKKKYGEVHVLAVCQPTVPTLASVARMAAEKSKFEADSLILMGGSIDTRESPTEVNKYAEKHDLNWFKNNVIYSVPPYYKGVNRKVYPGFLQYSGFVAMNMLKHTQANIDFFNNLLKDADLSVQKHEKFYDEYNAVMDLPAKFYLETLENTFIDQKLAKGILEIDGIEINLKNIKNTRLFTIEGELDDISGPGQTHSAIKLCSSLKKSQKKMKTFEGVGHYGVFSGKKWRNMIYPEIKNFIIKS